MKAWYCGGATSAWSAIQNFTTADECENVINFAVSTPTNTKASFTWDSTSAYSFARIKLREDTNWWCLDFCRWLWSILSST